MNSNDISFCHPSPYGEEKKNLSAFGAKYAVIPLPCARLARRPVLVDLAAYATADSQDYTPIR